MRLMRLKIDLNGIIVKTSFDTLIVPKEVFCECAICQFADLFSNNILITHQSYISHLICFFNATFRETGLCKKIVVNLFV